MTKNIEERKYKLIKEIMNLDNEVVLSRMENQLALINEDRALWSSIIRPIRDSISVQQMIEEQSYKPIEKDAFFGMVEGLEIEESIEELLSMLD